MAERVMCWLLVASALCTCCEGMCSYTATWPTCRVNDNPRVERGKADFNVITLNLVHCNITSLTPNDLVYPKLERLDLEYNSIKFIENGSFDALVSLDEVDLSDNRLFGKYLPSSLFRYCDKMLRTISLSNNNSRIHQPVC